MNRLRGKVIVVVGGGGIGEGCARRYAAEGASVLLGDLDEGAAATAAASINTQGGSALGVSLDGSDEESIRAALNLAIDEFGGIDGLHANFASFADSDSGDALELSMDVFDEVMRVNARGFLLCTRLVLPAIIARGGGSIVYTSSGAAHMALPAKVAYSMSKAASHALMRHVAVRFGPQKVRANVIAPGPITHPRFEAMLTPEFIAQMTSGTAIGRLGTSADIAAMGALLMSDEGSFITGQVLSVDGGSSMRP
jgi:NAD(P)-dependent dehydrogenase (short-subunit alcohol dehydrogenase family)